MMLNTKDVLFRRNAATATRHHVDLDAWGVCLEKAAFKTRILALLGLALFLIISFPLSVSAVNRDSAINEAIELQKKGGVIYEKKRYIDSLPFFERALNLVEGACGEQSKEAAESICNVANAYEGASEFLKARSLRKRALSIIINIYGHDNPHSAYYMDLLARNYKKTYEYDKSVELGKQAVEINERVLGADSLGVATLLSNLAVSYRESGSYAEAFPLFERSLVNTTKSLGENHDYVATILTEMANLYSAVGDEEKAIPLYNRAIAICTRLHGSMSPEVEESLSNLAVSYNVVGRYTEALDLHKRCVKIKERVYGAQHPYTAWSYANIAGAYLRQGEYDKAIEYASLAIDCLHMAKLDNSMDVTPALHVLGEAYMKQGKYSKALESLQKDLLISKEHCRLHPNRGNSSYLPLATACYLSGDSKTSHIYAVSASNDRLGQLDKVLRLDEQSRLKWQALNALFTVEPCVLTPAEVFAFNLHFKGIVFDSILEDRAVALAGASNHAGRDLMKENLTLRGKLGRLFFTDSPNVEQESTLITERIKTIERELAAMTTASGRTRRCISVTTNSVLQNINHRSVVVDFILFRDPKLKEEEARCYGALVVPNDGNIEFVRIDNADAVDSAVNALRSAIISGEETLLRENMKNLTTKLWQPISAKFPPDIRALVIAPDGALNCLSFAALPDTDGRFLAEKYEMVYVGSGRDLASPVAKDHNNQIALFANPVFDQSGMSSATNQPVMRSVEMAEFGQIKFPQLPGTEVEGKSLVQEVEAEGWAATAYFGDKATEQQIRALKKPGILHLATHGFYLNALTPSDDNTRGMKLVGLDQNKPVQKNGKGVDPMRASGIALTGAQATIKAWSEGKAPDPENDGILTAEEVAGLDLEGTWLVTLSACETGVGEIKSGEGVFGLRRAFMMAGAQNLLMTLWPVSDVTTADIMKDFYHRALATDDAPRALADTQRDWLVKLRKEKGLLAAVRDAGPFIMTTMGALPVNATFSAPQKKNFLK